MKHLHWSITPIRFKNCCGVYSYVLSSLISIWLTKPLFQNFLNFFEDRPTDRPTKPPLKLTSRRLKTCPNCPFSIILLPTAWWVGLGGGRPGFLVCQWWWAVFGHVSKIVHLLGLSVRRDNSLLYESLSKAWPVTRWIFWALLWLGKELYLLGISFIC